ncbi:flavodoxin [Glaciecola sp. 1036]|uniref:flavodoxin n=1 Tax=Alteromonadaceae TaxID=72275 RepID=UPI003D058ABB
MRSVSIFAGSVYGNAQHVAEAVVAMLEKEGVDAQVFHDPDISDFVEAESVVIITSTTGQGDVPPNIELFFQELKDQFPLMNNKPFVVAGLGDSSYGDSYCGAGRQFFELLQELQGNPIADMLEVDAIETLSPEDEVVPFIKANIERLTQ